MSEQPESIRPGIGALHYWRDIWRYRELFFSLPGAIFSVWTLYIAGRLFQLDCPPQSERLLYLLNPMVGVIDGFRWAVLGDAFQVYWSGMILSAALTLLMFVGGCSISGRWKDL